MDRIIAPLGEGDSGEPVAALHAALDALAQGGLLGPASRQPISLARQLKAERARQAFGEGTLALVARFQAAAGIDAGGKVDERTAEAINAALERLGKFGTEATAGEWPVSGTVQSASSAGVGGLRVLVVDKGIGGDLALAEAVTDSAGRWQTAFDPAKALRKRGKERPDLQARLLLGEDLLAVSPTAYDAVPGAVLDIALGAAASARLASEYEALSRDLAARTDLPVAELKEGGERQDITWLANKTGWDARAVASAALAGRMAAGDDGIEPGYFYAAIRAGLPAERDALLRTDPQQLRAAWSQAVEAGILPAAMKDGIDKAAQAFARAGAALMLDSPAAPGASSVAELLPSALASRDDQLRYAEIVTRAGGDPALVDRAAVDAFGEDRAAELRGAAQLARLTRGNAPVMARLRKRLGARIDADPASLVDAGLDRAEGWSKLIGDNVPDDLPGADREARAAAYAERMAAELRLAFPTASLARAVGAGEVPLMDDAARPQVQTFLRENAAGFDIGAEPVAAYVRRSGASPNPEVVAEVGRLQRVRQITPDAAAMNGLLAGGIGSATEVMRQSEGAFVRRFATALGGEAVAAQVYRKAEQVHGAVLNLAAGFIAQRNAPGIGVPNMAPMMAPGIAPANVGDVLAYGTLESVLGEMDYCACDHCRSVLGPAAYMVDLLQFLDASPAEVPAGKQNPQAVLLGRRPDIAHLPLNCENTNTPLPYIDLVNETLEYFVAHNLSLAGFEGFTTDPETAPEDLLANPANVRAAAYDSLATASYPPPLPFDRPLEMQRRLLGSFEADLATVMEELRASDALEAGGGAGSYGYRDIRAERLGLSTAEHRLLTRGWPDAGPAEPVQTTARLFGYGATASEATVRTGLTGAKAFARRSGVSYEELARILRTRFINPGAELLPMLERLGVSFGQIAAFAAGTLPTLTYAAGVDPADYGGNIGAWLKDPARLARIMGLVVLNDSAPPGAPGTPGDFDSVTLGYSNPDPARSALRLTEFVRLGRFIRLWRKLGWTIEEVDAALTALWDTPEPAAGANDAARLAALDAGFLAVLPRLAVVAEAMGALKLNRTRDLPSLLALAGPIGSWGPASLYARLFFGRRDLPQAFRRTVNGAILADPAAKLLDHREELRAAFGLRPGEVDSAAKALGFDAATPLDLASVSALYRHGWLARRLNLSVEELVALIAATGIDPFGLPDPVAPGLLRLIGLIDALREAGLAPAKALALIWNEGFVPADPGTEAPVLTLARDLRAGLAGSEAALAVPAEPDIGAAKALLALAYPAEAAQRLAAALEGTTILSAPFDHSAAELSAAAKAAGRGRIAYDDFAKRLTYAGPLTGTVRDALKGLPGVPAAFKAAVDALSAQSQAAFGDLFADQPELGPLYQAYLDSADPVPVRLRALLAALLPGLVDRARRARAVEIAAAGGGSGPVDPGLAGALLGDAARLHAAGAPARPGIDDLLALDRTGLTVAVDDGTPGAAPFAVLEAALPDFGPGRAPLPKPGGAPGAAVRAVLDGWLLGMADGPVQLILRTDPGAAVTLQIDGNPVAMANDGGGQFSNAGPVTLRADAPVAITVTVTGASGLLRLFWRVPGGGRTLVPAAQLFPAALVEALRTTQLRLLKAAALGAALDLPPATIAALAGEATLAIGGAGWLSTLGVRGPASAGPGLLPVLEALLLHARLRKLAAEPDALLPALEALRNGDPAPLLAQLRRGAADLTALLTRLGVTAPDIAAPALLARALTAMTRAQGLGLGMADLIAAATSRPDEAANRRLSAALRARFAPADWLGTIRPVNDAMRALQRDALVAWCLFQFARTPASAHIDSVDKLFEFFLMDVAMQPNVLTSRVRNALSSIQTFTERCLMGLEANVAPASIDPARWAWMKRYRVWEANRKVFLFPENWLDPGLRDDQSPIFRETVSQLMQGDVTEERAFTALSGYLTKLDAIAKLEIAGIYHELRGAGETPVIHTIGRTAGARREYFYRKREAMLWSPWTPIRLDIEDGPVMPVVWDGRLFLFWLKVIQTPIGGATPFPGSKPLGETPASSLQPTQTTPQNYIHVILSWSELVGGEWQAQRTSNIDDPLYLTAAAGTGTNRFDRRKLALAALNWSAGGLRVSVTYGQVSAFFLYNPYAEPEQRVIKDAPHFGPKRTLETAGSDFSIRYGGDLNRVLATTIDSDNTVAPSHPLATEAESAGFFYQDARRAFYVTTEVTTAFVFDAPAVIGNIGNSAAADLAKLATKWRDKLRVEVVNQELIPGFGVIDPSPEPFRVTEDARINVTLQTGGTIAFDGIQIGAKGAQIDRVATVKGR